MVGVMNRVKASQAVLGVHPDTIRRGAVAGVLPFASFAGRMYEIRGQTAKTRLLNEARTMNGETDD